MSGKCPMFSCLFTKTRELEWASTGVPKKWDDNFWKTEWAYLWGVTHPQMVAKERKNKYIWEFLVLWLAAH